MFTATLCKLQLRCGSGCLKAQEKDFIDSVDFPIACSVDQPLPLRLAGSKGGGGGSRPLAEGSGYSAPVEPLSLLAAAQFCVSNKHVANINMFYECILGDDAFDMASAVAIDLGGGN